ncbi:hypothetical protein GEMRC1_003619 [Eukaryota sp. GEM-RC1]
MPLKDLHPSKMVLFYLSPMFYLINSHQSLFFSCVGVTLEVSLPRATQGSDCVMFVTIIDKTHKSLQKSALVNIFAKPSILSQVLLSIRPGCLLVLRSAIIDKRSSPAIITINSLASKFISVHEPSSTPTHLSGLAPPPHFLPVLTSLSSWCQGFFAQQSGSIQNCDYNYPSSGRLIQLNDDDFLMTSSDSTICRQTASLASYDYHCCTVAIPSSTFFFHLSCLVPGMAIRIKQCQISKDEGQILCHNRSSIIILHEVLTPLFGIPSLESSAIKPVINTIFASETTHISGLDFATRHLFSFIKSGDFPSEKTRVLPSIIKCKVHAVYPSIRSDWSVNVCSGCKAWSSSCECLSCSSLESTSVSRLVLLVSCLTTSACAKVVVLDTLTPNLFEKKEGDDVSLIDELVAGDKVATMIVFGFRNKVNSKTLMLLKLFKIEDE